MKKAIPPLTLIIALAGILQLAAPVTAQQPDQPTGTGKPPIVVTAVEPNAPDPGAARIEINGSFEAEPPDAGWTLDEQSLITEGPFWAWDGDHAMTQGWRVNEHAVAVHELEGIDWGQFDEPIWLHSCVKVRTDHIFTDEVWDVCEGALFSDAGQHIAWLWQYSNLDAGPVPEWQCNWYVIENLTLWGDRVDFVLASDNDGSQVTSCTYDGMAFYGTGRHKTFLPLVQVWRY